MLGTARAAIFHPAVAQHLEACRHHVELLARLLTEGLEQRTVVRTHPLVLGQLVHDVDAWQVFRQGAALATPAPLVTGDSDRLLIGLLGLLREFLGLVEQPQLAIGHALVRGAEAAREQLPDLLLQRDDGCLARGDRRASQISRALPRPTDLRQAIARRELFVVYQPQVDLGSGEVTGGRASPTIDLELVDLRDEPARAAVDAVVVTPTLVKLSPPPRAMVIGDLSDVRKLAATLGVSPG